MKIADSLTSVTALPVLLVVVLPVEPAPLLHGPLLQVALLARVVVIGVVAVLQGLVEVLLDITDASVRHDCACVLVQLCDQTSLAIVHQYAVVTSLVSAAAPHPSSQLQLSSFKHQVQFQASC